MIIDCKKDRETEGRSEVAKLRSCKMGTICLAIVRQLIDNRLAIE